MPEHGKNNECAGCDNCDFLPYDLFSMVVSTEIISSHRNIFVVFIQGIRAGVKFPALLVFAGVSLRTVQTEAGTLLYNLFIVSSAGRWSTAELNASILSEAERPERLPVEEPQRQQKANSEHGYPGSAWMD